MERRTNMLGDEVAGSGMKASGEEATHQEVHHAVPAEELDDQAVECNLHGQVETVDVRERQLENCHGSQSIEQDLERAEECLPKD
jgi:hypothetical protein